MILTALAVLPGALMVVYVYKKDWIEGEPKGLIALLLLLGALSVIPVAIVENILTNTFTGSSIFYCFIENFIFVALTEEFFKFLMLLTTWKNKAFDYQFDGVVYAVSVSMGFAIVENIMYVLLMGGLQTALLRAITSIPGHALFGLYMGHYYGKAKMAEKMKQPSLKRKNLCFAILIPVLLHGAYDFFASTNAFIFIVFVIVIEVYAFVNLKSYSKGDMPFPNIQ